MAHLTADFIEQRLKLLKPGPDLIYDVLEAYELPKSSLRRLKSGETNKAKQAGDILWRGKLCYIQTMPGLMMTTVTEALNNEKLLKQKPRFIIASDGSLWKAYDTKTAETRDIKLTELYKHVDFFLPWAGIEKAVITTENPADIRAAQRMGKLFDSLKKDNKEISPHDLNIFLARLLFCFFAEDSGIFDGENIFTSLVESVSQKDGSDLHVILARVFDVMNTPMNHPSRQGLPLAFAQFPYVNGGLFGRSAEIPKFSPKSREAIIEAGHQDWEEINTDIFGNMFQACLDKDMRQSLGEHYTSVPNIMKVLKPLLLDELQEAAEEAKGDVKAVDKLIARIENMRFFDPACGSGNFLLVAFKELRRLEMDLLESVQGESIGALFPRVTIHQFYGIEIDDFAHEIAMLSMWLVDHQMNNEFYERIGARIPTLPLKKNDNIKLGNALRIDWKTVCPPKSHEAKPLVVMEGLLEKAYESTEYEVYIFGNPPYVGGKKQTPEQKAEQISLFDGYGPCQDLDYVSCWFMQAARYITGPKISAAFVSTNSITQGNQVPKLWEAIFSQDVAISFAETSFKWTNNAKHQAGVTCIIVGLCSTSKKEKRKLYSKNTVREVENITPYLTTGENILVGERTTTMGSVLPPLIVGNAPVDGGNLICTPEQKAEIIAEDTRLAVLFKRFMGAIELLRDQERYCLWITDELLPLATSNEKIRKRLEAVSKTRLESKKKSTQSDAKTPHKFRQITYKPSYSILVPAVSSEMRRYIPFGYVDENTIIINAFAIYDAEPWVFGIISSAMHMAWARTTCGRLKTDFRYSAKLCYNTFPIRKLTDTEKENLTQAAYEVLDIRQGHTEMTLGEMYNPETMPDDLKEAHEKLDVLVDSLYRNKPFNSDEERLECLFALYKEMTA